MNPREQFWQWALERLEQFESVKTLEDIARRVLVDQRAMIAAEPFDPSEPNPDWVGGRRAQGQPQAFFMPWAGSERTAVHAHPNRMLVVVLRGRLLVSNYAANGETLVDTTSLAPGEWVVGVSDAPGYEHFPHAIEARGETLSFHLYGDDPALGRRFA